MNLTNRYQWAAGACLIACVFAAPAWAIGQASYVSTQPVPGGVRLASAERAAPLHVDASDWPGVIRAARDLQADVRRVTGREPVMSTDGAVTGAMAVLIGTVGKSPTIDRLAREGKIDVRSITGKWESFFLQTVIDPVPGVRRAIVIAGSDKRGTIYGIYDLSEQIGVSPWYWWSDVTPIHRAALYIRPGTYRQGEPSVKYRGIFLNDEKPDLDRWVREKFGEHPAPGNGTGTVANFDSRFYAHVFELILRLKGNYLWPAMWNNAFAEDDPDNPRLADEYGIVMGTSHQEPMLRAQKEWDWHDRAAYGNWNYATHPDVLDAFWRDGIRARKDFDNIFTIGLRGENDSAMVQGSDESITLLERIVSAQRAMIAEEVNPDVTKVPQLWCLYKEVQGYYESGLRVPDDVTLLWAEDNWGDVRRLPTAEERTRAGGAGIYYHFDYHGGPRSYQWINTNPISKIWDQMSLAKQYGADRVWIVNVGHLKGYELPTEYFLDLAWDTNRWTGANLDEYTARWAAREFGAAHAAEIADILTKYTTDNGRRKPELLDAGTYSLVNYQEAERVVHDYDALAARAESLARAVPEAVRDAFYELVLFPVKASAQVNALYLAAAKNALFATQHRASTNDMADEVRRRFKADGDLMAYFNKTFANGRWDHFMDQPHIGYTSWADPPENNLNAIHLAHLDVPAEASLGVAPEGTTLAWPGPSSAPALPPFDVFNRQRHYVDVFDRGQSPFTFDATPSAPWIVLGATHGAVAKDVRVWVTIDWTKVPSGTSSGTVRLSGTASAVVVAVHAFDPPGIRPAALDGFVEGDGYVSMEAEHFSSRSDAGSSRWTKIQDYGRTLSGLRATAAVDAGGFTPGTDAASLQYKMYLFTTGTVTTTLTLSPSLNFVPGRAVRIAAAFDQGTPQILTVVPEHYSAQNGNADWEQSVRDDARLVTVTQPITAPGYHTLTIWMVDPGIVLERLLVETPASRHATSYLGPPESYRGTARTGR